MIDTIRFSVFFSQAERAEGLTADRTGPGSGEGVMIDAVFHGESSFNNTNKIRTDTGVQDE